MKYKILSLLMFVLFFSVLRSQENYFLEKIEIRGNNYIPQARLFDQISMKQNSGWRRLLFWKKKHRFQQSDLQLDLQNLTAFYQREGFLQVQIVPEYSIDEENERVELILNILENPPVIISEIDFDIQSPDNIREELNLLLPRIERKMNLKQGNRFRDKEFNQSQAVLLERLQQAGYPFCEVDFDLFLSEDQFDVLVRFIVIPHGKRKYGSIEVKGNQKVTEKTILKQLTFQKGETFRPKDLQKTQRNLQQLNMFQYVTLQIEQGEKMEDEVNVVINVKEAPRLNTRLSAGYGLEEQIRTELNITKLGFFGEIRKAVFIARHTYLEPYKISVDLIQPSFFHPRASLTLNPFLLKKNETGYEKESAGIYLIYKIAFANFSNISFDYDFEWNNLTAKSDFIEEQLLEQGKIDYQLSSFSLGYHFNNSEPVLSPAEGWIFGASSVFSGLGFYSDYHYYRLHAEVRKYTSLAERIVLAARLECGVMEPTRKDELTPLAERFYAGGRSSVRGWKHSELGPLNEEGVPKGGNSLLEAGAEIRFPLYKILSGVLFLDAGNVWSESYRHELNDLRYAAGAGLRFRTPLGSIRLDAAYPIFETALPVQFYLSIGESF